MVKKFYQSLLAILFVITMGTTANAISQSCVDYQCDGTASTVEAYTNSLWLNPLDTGIALNIGDLLTVTVDEVDLWGAGKGARISNADGLDNFSNYEYGGLSEKYGTLVGKIGAAGSYFSIGTSFTNTVAEQGNLFLMYWDSNYSDNFGFVSACVEVDPIPEPTTMLLFGTGIAGLAAVGRRRRK